jgi:DNA-binding CsgD family transcriptional regulator
MTTELRNSGIEIVGDIPWGTHFCHFYETKRDLFDILIPYFKTGLDNNEFCAWVIFPPNSTDETRERLKRAIPGIDQHLAAGDMEILPHEQWYLKGGSFNIQGVIDGWGEKLTQALAKGYAGMRVNGNEAWLTKENWKKFSRYEEKLNNVIANQRIIVLCTYLLDLLRAAEVFDVTDAHQFAIARRRGKWEILESPELKEAKAELKKMNEELERRVVERTSALQKSNAKLEIKAHELEEVNTTLGVLLKRREQDQKELIDNVQLNIEELIQPYLRKLNDTRLNEIQRTCVDGLKSGILEISSSFIYKLSQKHANLSPMQVQIAILIKGGKESKEIANILGVSLNTVMVHRYHLRTKLGIKGDRVNLRSYLSSIDLQL